MSKQDKDEAIIKELQEMTKDEKSLAKTKKKMKFVMITLLTLNILAGLLIGSIYIALNNYVFLIIGGVLILSAIPIYIIFQRIQQNISLLGEKNKNNYDNQK
jgi:1,4-dihydroxy-2-naphthoate octaprenyltransferase